MLGRLEFWGVRRQEEEVDVLGDAQLNTGVPTGAIQDEDDLLGGSGADLARDRHELGSWKPCGLP